MAARAQQVTAIVGADVLPMTGTERLTDQTVLIEGDRIAAIGPRRSTRVPAGARRIEARGMTLMPGLVDMHIHLSPDPGRAGDSTQRALALSLAHGVTTARVMIGQPGHPALRAAVERGEIAGPRLYVASPPLHQGNTPTAEQARATVSAAREAGFDLIKFHQLPSVEVWQAAQDEARRLGIPTSGHVANQIGLERAMAAGQQIEHLDSAFLTFLPAGAPQDFGQFLPPHALDAASQASDADYAALARRVAAARSYQVPTLSLFERLTGVGTPIEQLLGAPDARYTADWIIGLWRQQRAQFADGWTSERGNQFRDIRRRLVRAYRAAGVPVMAGSDTPHPFQVWGVALLREVEALGAAGLSPMDALRSATVVPRNYFRSLPNGGSSLGWRADFGTVEAGARADLILLASDPSRDLRALHSLRAVIAAGRVHDRVALDEMLERAARDGKAQPAPQGQPPGAG
jgi:imidazolonepropionase-like amidohydrolase